MTQQQLDRSLDPSPLKRGDVLLWLYRENDHRFGAVIEVICVRGDKVDFFFPENPNWRTTTATESVIRPGKAYTLEDVKRIKAEEAKKRRRFASIIYILIFMMATLQWGLLNKVREVIAGW